MCNERGFGHHHLHGCFPFAGKELSKMMHGIGRHIHECMDRFGTWVPYNLEETEDGYLYTVPLSGRTKEDVKVSLIGNSLNIKATKPKIDEREKAEKKQEHPFLKYFFKFVDVDMDIPLPANANLDLIKSVMANGLLRIKVGKKPSKNIDIGTEGNN
ncbi:MAG: Hsp20/alpha crystallin family protein [Promethearchaeota archaeon]